MKTYEDDLLKNERIIRILLGTSIGLVVVAVIAYGILHFSPFPLTANIVLPLIPFALLVGFMSRSKLRRIESIKRDREKA